MSEGLLFSATSRLSCVSSIEFSALRLTSAHDQQDEGGERVCGPGRARAHARGGQRRGLLPGGLHRWVFACCALLLPARPPCAVCALFVLFCAAVPRGDQTGPEGAAHARPNERHPAGPAVNADCRRAGAGRLSSCPRQGPRSPGTCCSCSGGKYRERRGVFASGSCRLRAAAEYSPWLLRWEHWGGALSPPP